jgi:hypothetical protein
MKCIGIVLAIVCAVAVTGCDTGTHQRLNCICLIDYSGSLPDQTLRRYVEIISSDVLKHMGEWDRLVVLPIDEGAKTEAVTLVNEDFADNRFTYPSDGYAHAKDSLVMRLRHYADRNGPKVASELLREKDLRTRYTYYSDIFSALEQASGLLERPQPDSFWPRVGRFITGKKKIESTNVIIVFSDMIQESSECSFAGPEGCTPEAGHAILEKLKSWNRIPDLQGCTVFVNGRTGKNNLQVENNKSFWLQYFKEAHAELAAYDYDSGTQITPFLRGRLMASR